MKTRVTFRVSPALAEGLRRLPNQTQFVETVLRRALGNECPLCAGSGRVPVGELRVTDFRENGLPKLDRQSAVQLKRLVKLGRELAATTLQLQQQHGTFEFTLAREAHLLLRGAFGGSELRIQPN